MKRRTFIAGVGTTTTLFLAGCNSSGDDTGSTTTGTDSSSTATGTGETTETTASEMSEGTTTESSETTTESSGTTTAGTRTVTYGEYATISDGLEVAVTGADTSDSYEHDGTTAKSDDGKTYVLLTFEAKNSAESSRSLPEDSTATIRANGDEYAVADAAKEKWDGYVSSSVNAGGTSSITVPFEVPKDAISSLDVRVALSYTDSGSKRLVQWSME
ncbi:DUF4352 domain-containing protein [Haladaptatus sp. DYF46]|uniref:DUF4352 domain-containing protein n=1 Tax=Haladaptatus sp. DYF46 TaxID=2886041 RepID=UPI001E4D111B|nr:DUF4352 domain-containing protein [Haladaptatus sp. DYF46]